jgi:hypothetical protein
MSNVILFLVFAVAIAAAYILATAWLVEKTHKFRMEMAELGARLISQDSLLPADEQRIVAWMLTKAYSPGPMVEVTIALPSSFWGLLVSPTTMEQKKSKAYSSLRSRPEGERFVSLFALSIMVANPLMTLIFSILNGFIAPFLTLRGGTTRANERAVDRVVAGHATI